MGVEPSKRYYISSVKGLLCAFQTMICGSDGILSTALELNDKRI